MPGLIRFASIASTTNAPTNCPRGRLYTSASGPSPTQRRHLMHKPKNELSLYHPMDKVLPEPLLTKPEPCVDVGRRRQAHRLHLLLPALTRIANALQTFRRPWLLSQTFPLARQRCHFLLHRFHTCSPATWMAPPCCAAQACVFVNRNMLQSTKHYVLHL